MCILLQIELSHYVDNHGFDTIKQDDGIVILMPVYRDAKPTEKPLPDTCLILLGIEAQFITTYREARAALGY